MSQIAAGHHDHANGHAHGASHAHEEAHVAARRRLDLAAVTPEPGFGSMAARVLWAVGVVGVLLTVLGAFTTGAAGEIGRAHV